MDNQSLSHTRWNSKIIPDVMNDTHPSEVGVANYKGAVVLSWKNRLGAMASFFAVAISFFSFLFSEIPSFFIQGVLFSLPSAWKIEKKR
jgi:hypothetical protein